MKLAWKSWRVALLVVALAVSAGAAPAAKKAAKAPVHPAVDPAQPCADCHQEQYKQWDQSRHATASVLCVVCHQSVTENFVKRPVTARCQGCHAAQVESLPASMSPRNGNGCFSCHAPHTLKVKKAGMKAPHTRVSLGGGL